MNRSDNNKVKKPSALRTLMGYAGPLRWLLVGSWVLSATSALMGLAPLVYIWQILHDVLDGRMAHVAHYGWVAVGWAVAAMAVYVGALMCSHVAAFRVATNIRRRLLRHIVRLPLGFMDGMGSGRLRKTVNEASAATETYLAHRLPDMAGSYATPAGMLVLLFWFDWHMGLLCMATVALAFAILFAFMIGPTLRQTMTEYQNALDRMSNEAVEYVRGIPVVKTFGQTVFSFKRFKQTIDDYSCWVIGYTRSVRTPMIFYTTISNGVFAVLVGYALWAAAEAATHAFLLNLVYYVIVSPVLTLMLTRIMFQSEDLMLVEDALHRIGEVMAMEPLPETASPRQPRDHGIVLADVSFAYPSARGRSAAVSHVSLEVKAGEHVAFVGPSGGGKTTLASLVARFWDADSGVVSVGGVDVKQIAKHTMMDTVSFVFQDSRLLKTSILENVRLGRPAATRAEVEAALEAAQCGDIVARLPRGIDTVIGSRGTYLSGGEQQRVGIARAMLRNTPILILDEATAFADPDNEERVLRAFDVLGRGKTVLMIAHRLSTVVRADRIFVLSNGSVAEQGTHAELLAQGGLYASMWKQYNETLNYQRR